MSQNDELTNNAQLHQDTDSINKSRIHFSLLCAVALFLAGVCCLFLPIKLCFVPGIIFTLSGLSLGIHFWLKRIRGIGTFDRQLSRGWWSQITLLFSAVAIVFLLGAGLLLLFKHDFDKTYTINNCFEEVLYIAHRFLGYNYYGDGDITNTSIFVLSFLGTVFVGGLLITTLSNIVQQRKDDIERGAVKYKKLKDHIVVVGFGNYALFLTKNTLVSDNKAQVLLMTNKDVRKVWSRIKVELPESVINRVFLISGEMTSEDDVREKLCISSAKAVYILGEATEFGVDSKCIECARIISDARGSKDIILPVFVHQQHLYSNKYIKSADSPSPLKDSGSIFFRPFCFYENWSRLLWGYHSLPQYAPLDLIPVTENNHVHLVIVGLNTMGAALALQACRICHYPHFNGSNKTVISIIEKDPEIIDEFKSIYPGILQLEDVTIRFEQKPDGHFHSFESFSDELDKLARADDIMLTVAICYRDPDQAISAALRLPESVYYLNGKIGFKKEGNTRIPLANDNKIRTQVLIRQEVDQGFGHILDADSMHYKNYHIFGMFNEGLDLDLLDDTMPMLAKDNYDKMSDGSFLADFQNIIQESSLDSLVAKLNKKWQQLKEWDRASNRCQIDLLGTYLKVLAEEGLLKAKKEDPLEWDIDDFLKNGYYKLFDGGNRPDGVPGYDNKLAIRISEIEHRRWNAERKIAGWRAPDKGEERMDAFYIHNNIVPFDTLDEQTQYKDIIVLRAAPLIDAIRRKKINQKNG